jgi:hypothetical protein
MRTERGQGSLEYLAIVLLAVVVLGSGATAAAASGAGADIATVVPHQVMRALCIVTRGDCDRDRAPCDVASASDTKSWAVTVAVIKIGDDKTVTITRRSDGTYAVTLDTAPGGGLETSAGAKGKVSLGKRSFSVGADATGGITGSYAHTRTWIVQSNAAAQQIKAAIKNHDPLPPATVEGHEGALDLGVEASGSAVRVANASAGVGGAVELGRLTDHETGNRTYLFRLGVAGNATAAVRGRAKPVASVAGSDGDRYALTVAPDGRWLDLAVTRTGSLTGKADLPAEVAKIADELDVPTAGGRQWVSEWHLDLTDAESLAAARAVVARALDPLHPGALADALVALSRRVHEHAVVDVRTYALDRTTRGAQGHVAAEIKVGGKYEVSTENTRLLAAATRGIDGQWRVRDDCLKETTT